MHRNIFATLLRLDFAGFMSRAGLTLFAFDPNDPDTKAAIKAATDEAVAGLRSKNDELLGEVKRLRKSSEIKPEQLEEVERERDELRTKLTAAEKAAKDAGKLAETATKNLATETAFTQRLLIDNGLTAELTKHGVTNPVHIKAAQAMLRQGVQIVADGENRVAKVGEKALGDFVKEWAAGDEGKHFVTAPNNTGGGAPGGAGKPGAKQITRAEFDGLDATARAEHFKAGGTITN